MEGRKRRIPWGRPARVAAAVLAIHAAPAVGGDEPPNVRLANSTERFAVAQALRSAAEELDRSRCSTLLDDFRDASGRPLRAGLEQQGLSFREYLGRVFFYDAPSRLCGTSALAITAPGSHAIFICGARFVRELSRNGRHARATIIHETLHSLGLGENPPSSDEITSRVLALCG
jgi:hypothetical protein